LAKRPAVGDEQTLRNPHTGGGGGGTTGGGGGTTPPPAAGVILLDFDGQTVSGTNWNTNGNIVCAPANLTSSQIATIFSRVTNDYAPFNVVVTTDEAVYNAADPYKRTRVIIPETWEWFGQAGGTSFRGSFTWGNNTPCFVFSSLLNYNEKNVGEAASHEAGHTLGLRHQASYNGTVMLSAYNTGIGSGEISWAPIMGSGYYRNMTVWANGPTDVSSTSFEDEVSMITSAVGARPDDYSNTTSGAAILSTSLSGYINNSSDVDYFSVNISSGKTLSAVPFNVGASNDGADIDLVIHVYNAQGQLINTIDDPAALSASTTLAAGQYYVSVSSIANSNSGRYGMLGQYTVSLN